MLYALGPEAGLLKGDSVGPRWQIDMDRAGRPRAGLERAGRPLELEEDVGQGNVAFVADIGYQHLNGFRRSREADQRGDTS